MKKEEAEEIIIQDKCDDCKGFPGCYASGTLSECEGFNEKVNEVLIDELDMFIRNRIIRRDRRIFEF